MHVLGEVLNCNFLLFSFSPKIQSAFNPSYIPSQCQGDGSFDNLLTISRFTSIGMTIFILDRSDFLTSCCIRFSIYLILCLSRKFFSSYKLL